MYYVLLRDLNVRTHILSDLKAAGIQATFHYVPLHDTEPGKRYCRAHGDLRVTEDTSDRLVRMPIWVGMPEATVERVVEIVARRVGAAS
jgi:dTDP-4-amino-4,6-dideoxygalactose transaminase